MAGFKRGIGTRAKTKLDVERYKCSCFQMMEQARCYKSESLDARPAGNLRLT